LQQYTIHETVVDFTLVAVAIHLLTAINKACVKANGVYDTAKNGFGKYVDKE
jgi:hypothetical protein